MTDTTSEEYRRQCEARSWLQHGYINAAKVDALMATIADRRGQQAADELREEMRIQWKTRTTWWEGAPL